MFARKVAARLKPNSLKQFTNLLECEILPWLRDQEGFVDLITLASRDGKEVATITFWDLKANAHAYHSNGYPVALKTLEKILDGTPNVKTFEVVSSTFQMGAGTRLTAVENQGREVRLLQPAYRSCETSA